MKGNALLAMSESSLDITDVLPSHRLSLPGRRLPEKMNPAQEDTQPENWLTSTCDAVLIHVIARCCSYGGWSERVSADGNML